jgi:hypothetical protein
MLTSHLNNVILCQTSIPKDATELGLCSNSPIAGQTDFDPCSLRLILSFGDSALVLLSCLSITLTLSDFYISLIKLVQECEDMRKGPFLSLARTISIKSRSGLRSYLNVPMEMRLNLDILPHTGLHSTELYGQENIRLVHGQRNQRRGPDTDEQHEKSKNHHSDRKGKYRGEKVNQESN